jgi:hypothetical protein
MIGRDNPTEAKILNTDPDGCDVSPENDDRLKRE